MGRPGTDSTVLLADNFAFTWLLTQTTTRAVPDLCGLVEEAGFEVTEMRTDLLGSWAEVVAGRPDDLRT